MNLTDSSSAVTASSSAGSLGARTATDRAKLDSGDIQQMKDRLKVLRERLGLENNAAAEADAASDAAEPLPELTVNSSLSNNPSGGPVIKFGWFANE